MLGQIDILLLHRMEYEAKWHTLNETMRGLSIGNVLRTQIQCSECQ